MKNKAIVDLSTDYQKDLGNCHLEARKSLKTLARVCTEMVQELDRYGRHVSLSPLLRRFSAEYLDLLMLAGKIDAMRHSTASIDTLLNCGRFSGLSGDFTPVEAIPSGHNYRK